MNFQNAAYLFLAMLLFAAVHSLTAGSAMKNLLTKVLGNATAAGWYRLFYNLFSVLTLLPLAALMLWLPDAELYRVGAPTSWVMRTLQVVSVVGALIALVSTDFWHFVGLSQAVGHLSGQSVGLASGQLTVTGLYRFMRHPLYFFSSTHQV